MEVAGLWEWQDNIGAWTRFSGADAARLEAVWPWIGDQSKRNCDLEGRWFVDVKRSYMASWDNPLVTYPVRRREAASGHGRWSWKGDGGIMVPYSASDSQRIELAKTQGQLVAPLDGGVYEVDIAKMKQRRKDDHKRTRLVQRTVMLPARSAANLRPSEQMRAVGAAPQQQPPPPLLPPGWEAQLDDASGRPFYINHHTQTTQWEPVSERLL
jgi:hypothetical protein